MTILSQQQIAQKQILLNNLRGIQSTFKEKFENYKKEYEQIMEQYPTTSQKSQTKLSKLKERINKLAIQIWDSSTLLISSRTTTPRQTILQQLKTFLTPEVRLRNVNLLLRFENSLYELFLEVNSFLTNVNQR